MSNQKWQHTGTAPAQQPLRGLLSYRISSFSKREEKIKKKLRSFSVLSEVWRIKLHFKMPVRSLLGISGGGNSVLCHGKYLLSTAFLIQPSEFDPSFYQAVRNSENERVTRHFSHSFSHALVRARLPLLRRYGIPMASSQALQPCAVACSGTSGSLYEHDFFSPPHPAHPLRVCLLMSLHQKRARDKWRRRQR